MIWISQDRAADGDMDRQGRAVDGIRDSGMEG